MAELSPFDSLATGDTATLTRTVLARDLVLFAHACGDDNPLHRADGEFDHDGDGTPDRLAPAAWIMATASAAIGAGLPGPGALITGAHLTFAAPAAIGDTLSITVAVASKSPPNAMTIDVTITHSDGRTICTGSIDVIAPQRRTASARPLPGVLVQRENRLERLIESCSPLQPLRTAVVVPDEDKALAGALLARDSRLIDPILVGDPTRIRATAKGAGLGIEGIEVVPAANADMAAEIAVSLVHDGKVDALMKGNLHTDALLKHVIKSAGGLRMGRRISHCFVMDAPALEQLLVISDAAIAIAPTLEEKVDITQNAIDLARALGIDTPRVGVLSAVETVNPRIQSTLDAAVLSKMAERGQIQGGLVDGPLAMDNALSLSAAKTKGITGMVAGRADVLIAPNLEAGNILVKELTYAAGAEGGGLVVGAAAPIMLTSRADDPHDRLVSCALAILYHHWRCRGKSAVT